MIQAAGLVHDENYRPIEGNNFSLNNDRYLITSLQQRSFYLVNQLIGKVHCK